MDKSEIVSGMKGKVALVTGAGGMKGVGRAIALKFAALGVDLALSDVELKAEDLHPNQVRTGWRGIESVAEEAQVLGVRCLPVFCDLKAPKQIEDLVKKTVMHFGHIDILVNNARAIMGKDKAPITEVSDEAWHYFFAINVTAPFLLIKQVAREMIRRGKGGRIINIGSDSAKQANPMMTVYSSTKQALIGLTQAAALDLAPYGITVNCPCPGNTNTDRLSYWERAQAEAKGITFEEYRAGVVKEQSAATPMGRIAEMSRTWSLSWRPTKPLSLPVRPTTSTEVCSSINR
jgi:3-oxoacyl-[acyl-carrier protein] reductase/meso-butanediol dehydrogenase/(S,S)-butanediol dehydrogenase/diacetyl reductase